eukprot:5421243-Pyramimonas_sp.AAC.1
MVGQVPRRAPLRPRHLSKKHSSAPSSEALEPARVAALEWARRLRQRLKARQRRARRVALEEFRHPLARRVNRPGAAHL